METTRIKSKIYLPKYFLTFFILGFFLMLIILPTSFPLAAADDEGVIPVTNNLEHQVQAVIFSNYVVWMDYRNDNGTGLNSDIYIYDLSDHQEYPICTNNMRQVRPDVYGTWIVWEDNRAGLNNWDLWGYDLNTGTEIQITQNPFNQNNPAIYGNLVVWEDVGRLGAARHDNDIYIKDLTTGATGEEYSITTAEGEQIDADIYGNYIVWTDRRSGNADIYLYDLSVDTDSDGTPNYRDPDDDGDNTPDVIDLDPDAAERALVTNPEKQHNPAIYGNYVVWQDNRNGNSDIFLYNLKNNTERSIATSSNEESVPRIYENYVVYETLIDTQREVFYYDLTTDMSYQITFQPSSQEYPDIYNRYVVWSDYRNDKDGRVTGSVVDNGDIYMYHIPRQDSKNTPPVVTSITAIPDTVEAGGEVLIYVEAKDDDGDQLDYSFTSTGGTFVKIENNIGTWRAPDEVGYYNISAYVSDSESFSNTIRTMVEVYKNHAPEILNISLSPETVKTGRATTITVLATDPDNDKLVYEFICSKGEISGCDSEYDNEITWTAPNKEGEYQIIVKVSDYDEAAGEILTTQQEFVSITVIPRGSTSDNDGGFLPGFGFFELLIIFCFVMFLKIVILINRKKDR